MPGSVWRSYVITHAFTWCIVQEPVTAIQYCTLCGGGLGGDCGGDKVQVSSQTPSFCGSASELVGGGGGGGGGSET